MILRFIDLTRPFQLIEEGTSLEAEGSRFGSVKFILYTFDFVISIYMIILFFVGRLVGVGHVFLYSFPSFPSFWTFLEDFWSFF